MGFRHAAPMGKGCSAGLGKQLKERIGVDRKIQGKQDPGCQKVVRIDRIVGKIDEDVGALGSKLDSLLRT